MEQIPGIEVGMQEEMSLVALRVGAAEALAAARLQTAQYISEAEAHGKPTAVRFVVREVVSASKPLTQQAAPANCDRIVVIPTADLDTTTSRLIVRLPSSAKIDVSPDTLFDFFVERVINHTERERYLVNELGVWRYGNAAEIAQIAPGKYRVLGDTNPEGLETVVELNRELSFKPDFDKQTSSDLTL